MATKAKLNAALYDRYQAAVAGGHIPHLLGVLPDSELGNAPSKYRTLARGQHP